MKSAYDAARGLVDAKFGGYRNRKKAILGLISLHHSSLSTYLLDQSFRSEPKPCIVWQPVTRYKTPKIRNTSNALSNSFFIMFSFQLKPTIHSVICKHDFNKKMPQNQFPSLAARRRMKKSSLLFKLVFFTLFQLFLFTLF